MNKSRLTYRNLHTQQCTPRYSAKSGHTAKHLIGGWPRADHASDSGLTAGTLAQSALCIVSVHCGCPDRVACAGNLKKNNLIDQR